MDIQYYGGNCIVLSNKNARLVIDDNLEALGQKSVMKDGDIVLFTGQHEPVKVEAKLIIDRPGEYEIAGVSIVGVAAQAHMDEAPKRLSTMYKITAGDINYVVTGHIDSELDEDQQEAIGIVDVMLVPVGGNGYTLDSVGALKLIKEIDPKLVIPTHYEDASLKYEVPQQTLQQAVASLGKEAPEAVAKLKLKAADLTDATQLAILSKS